MEFHKMHGCGNSFVVISLPYSDPTLSAGINWREFSKLASDKNFGVGSDGVMLIEQDLRNAADATSDFRVKMFNPDGSDMGMCGNGIRCVARFLYDMGKVRGNSIKFDVFGRSITTEVLEDGKRVKVNMGLPSFPDEPEWEQTLDIHGRSFQIHLLSMGNPHCVIFVPRLEKGDVTTYGPLIERHPLFPQRTNVEFVERLSSASLKIGVWERGAGLTLACGTGACASVAAAIRKKLCFSKCEVQLPGGDLEIEWDGSGPVLMSGAADYTFHGRFHDDFVSRFATTR